MSSSSTQSKQRRGKNPRDRNYSKRGRRTYRGQKRRKSRRPSRVQVRQGGQWIGIRVVNQLTGQIIKLILLPVVLVKHRGKTPKKHPSK